MKALLSKMLFPGIAFLLCTTGIMAQQDQRADPFLAAVASQFDNDSCYYLEIDYVREDKMAETRIEGKAEIWMMGEKYKMRADEFLVYFNGKKLWSQNTQAEEVYVSIPDPAVPSYLQTVPVQILKNYKNDFKYMFLGKHSYKNRQLAEIQLFPFDLSGPYSMIKIRMEPESKELIAFEIKHKEGILYSVELKNKTLVKEREGIFEFDPSAFPETEIIELIY